MTVIIPFCKHVVAKVTLVPCSVNLTDKSNTVGHGEVTINNARIIDNKGVRQTNQHMLFTGKYRCKTQRLSKEIGVGRVIPCWRWCQFSYNSNLLILKSNQIGAILLTAMF